MKEIGGYYEIEYSNIELGGLHSSALLLNSGRYALEYILRANNYKRIYVPYYICDVIFEPITACGVEYEFYFVDEQMEPVHLPDVKENEAFLYLNNFGFKNEYIQKLATKVKNLIVDNCQALFAPPVAGVDTFYSLRKFAGVPDGAFLYTNKLLDAELQPYDCTHTTDHLYSRGNVSPNAGFMQFRNNEQKLSGIGMGQMSATTRKFLNTYDFEKNKLARDSNFLYLHHALGRHNEYRAMDIDSVCGPLFYPLLTPSTTLKQQLIANKIYVSTVFPAIHNAVPEDSYENYLSHQLIRLPIDQRYSLADMAHMASIIKAHLDISL